MKEGEFYAIETFATTGSGIVNEKAPCSHYMIDYLNLKQKNFKNISLSEKSLLSKLYKYRSTLPFCQRWLKNYGINNYKQELKNLVKQNIVNTYLPLYDISDSFISQFEHTIMIYKDKTEILSRGNDY